MSLCAFYGAVGLAHETAEAAACAFLWEGMRREIWGAETHEELRRLRANLEIMAVQEAVCI